MSEFYTRYSPEQIAKIGNTVVFLVHKIKGVSKTKILKLLYILDELSIRKSGLPFLNLKYKVWKFGPVSEDIFIDLSSSPTILKGYIERAPNAQGKTTINPLVEFNDDEFSQNDLELLDFVTKKFGSQTAKELISYTHRKQSPWYNTAKENSVLELLENETISNSEFIIDLSKLVSHDERKKELYQDYLAYH